MNHNTEIRPLLVVTLTTLSVALPITRSKRFCDGNLNIHRKLEQHLATDAGHWDRQTNHVVDHPVIHALPGPLTVTVSHYVAQRRYSDDAAAR